jgi:hypothetical protein
MADSWTIAFYAMMGLCILLAGLLIGFYFMKHFFTKRIRKLLVEIDNYREYRHRKGENDDNIKGMEMMAMFVYNNIKEEFEVED